jgi:hypothetical protein
MARSRGESMSVELGWDVPLRYRHGAPKRLRGIDVFYELRWSDHLADRRVQFVNGQCLADKVIEDCPEGKRPALLLTDRDDVEEGARETDQSYVVVVNLPHYLQTARSNAAASYLAQRLGRGITRAKSFSEIVTTDDECQRPSVSPQPRPSLLPTGGHFFSPLVATNLPTITG